MVTASGAHQSSPANVLGKYRLIAELGRGGMAEVYLACVHGPAGFNKLVVIKQIKADLAEDPDFLTMFLEEARLAARLNHPNVVQTNEVGQDGHSYFIAMEFLEGQPYSRILHRLGRDRGLPLGLSLRILADVLAGLHHAHELADFDGTPLGVVHRDVTPHNVFVTYDGGVKIVDFGIAKAMNSSLETRTGVLKGKVGYMAPEQARGERVDRRADLFSVGVMLWEAAVGRRMWKGLSEVAVLHRLLAGDVPRPRQMRPDISERLEEICMKALHLQREYRYATAQELQADIESLIEGHNERGTAREAGRLVASHFEPERLKLKQIIESQLSRARTMPTGQYREVQLPMIEHATAATIELPVVRLSPDDDAASGPGRYLGTPSMTPSMMTPSASVPSHISTFTAGNSAGPASVVAPQSRSNRVTIAALAVAAATGGLAATIWLTRANKQNASVASVSGPSEGATTGASSIATGSSSTGKGPAPKQSAAIAAPSVATPASESASAEVKPAKVALKLTLKPANAIVLVDGEKQKDPTKIELERGTTYKLKIAAAGYVPEEREVTAADEPFDLKIELVPARIGAAPPPDDDDGDMKTPTKVPTRPIDEDDPYKKK